MTDHKREEITHLAKVGVTSITGSMLALCQQLAADPSMVVAIGLINAILTTAIDYGARALSPTERRKLDQMGLLMLKEIESHLQKGHAPRSDGFIRAETGIRSSSQELFEGLLEISRSEHQEDKLPYIGYLYVSILFTDKVSKSEANRLLRILKSLTYQEICILSMLSRKGKEEGLRTNCLERDGGSDELSSLMQECFELETWGLLSQINHDQGPHYGISSWMHVVPANLRITPYGKRLAELSHLSKIQENEIQAIRVIMQA